MLACLEEGAWTDQPKSETLRSPRMLTRRFSGFMSLWMTFLE